MWGLFTKKKEPEDRLLKMLNEHGDRVIIDKDGMVSSNFDHPEIKAELIKQFEALAKIKVCE